ncbi:MAG: Ig-like domain-containing protein [Cyclobacteriaceae bacterium]
MQCPLLILVVVIGFQLLTGCIGTDVVDDLANGSFTVAIQPPARTSLLVGETVMLTAERRTMSGEVISTESFLWISSNPEVADVNAAGMVQAVATGQTQITVASGDAVSEPVLMTVVEDENQIARISLSADRMSLAIGDKLQIMASATNVAGEDLMVEEYIWESSDEAIATVTASGLVTAVGRGSAEIVASAGGVESEPLRVMVGTTARSGTFMGSGNYSAQGTATLEMDNAGDVVLVTSEDFEADLALGTFIYLSNSTAGTETSNNGIEIADISDNPKGAKTFNISDINEEVELTTYRYVVILCKPARITFGFADLNE